MSPIKLTLSVAAVALLLFAIGASAALADDHDGDEAAFGDGTYVLVIPGVGDFEFEVDSEGEETVVAVMAPEGYEVDDDHPDKAAWKDAAGLEVEMKLDKIESKVAWSEGCATLNIHGGWIAVSKPDAEGRRAAVIGQRSAMEAIGSWPTTPTLERPTSSSGSKQRPTVSK